MTEDDDQGRVGLVREVISTLPGVRVHRSSLQWIGEIDARAMRCPENWDLPHAALRRTGGGVPGEAIVQFDIGLDGSADGWKACELLAWFVRDLSRAGDDVQLRVLGLPPGSEAHAPGESLRLVLDMLFRHAANDSEIVATHLRQYASDLADAIEMYDEEFESPPSQREGGGAPA